MQNEKTIVAFDMDGTFVNPFDISGYYQKMNEDLKFFYDLPAYTNMLEAIILFAKEHQNDPNVEIVIATSLNQNPECMSGKEYWIRNRFPDSANIDVIYVEYGVPKAQRMKRMDSRVFLIDDHSPNLNSFVSFGGRGIKVINHINGSGKNWKGDRIFIQEKPEEIVKRLDKIIFE